VTFRTRTFLGVFVATSLALAIALWLIGLTMRTTTAADLSQGLTRQAALASRLLAGRLVIADPEGEAARLGAAIGERVTFIRADGTVIGDSEIATADLPRLENHATRPEVVAARATGAGTAVRHSASTGTETMYAAATVPASAVAVVRVALPLAALDARMALVYRQAAVGLGAGLLAALVLIWLTSWPLARRLATKSASSPPSSTRRRGNWARGSPRWRATARTPTRF
jgi:two-component system phosphate regulon sensor histidine kinase PhoR